MPSWILAIDFGTSFTVAATRFVDRSPEIVDIGGERRMPSVVVIDPVGDVYVGRAAEDLALAHPASTLRALKNRLGDQVPAILGGRPYQVVSLVAELLRNVYAEVLQQMGEPPLRVHLTHPATWNQPRIARLVEAAAKAGLPEPLLLPEPVAAALSYAADFGLPFGPPVVIYDLGGGTFDCAVVSRGDAGFTVVGRPGGDQGIGGELFDELLVNHIGEQLDPDVWESVQVADDPLWQQVAASLRNEARKAKESLSTLAYATVMLPLPNGLWQTRVTRQELDTLVRPYIDSTITSMRRCIADAGVGEDELAGIVLVGGSTRSPIVEQMVRDAFPDVNVSRRGDPKATVAAGATLADPPAAPPGPQPAGQPTEQASAPTAEQEVYLGPPPGAVWPAPAVPMPTVGAVGPVPDATPSDPPSGTPSQPPAIRSDPPTPIPSPPVSTPPVSTPSVSSPPAAAAGPSSDPPAVPPTSPPPADPGGPAGRSPTGSGPADPVGPGLLDFGDPGPQRSPNRRAVTLVVAAVVVVVAALVGFLVINRSGGDDAEADGRGDTAGPADTTDTTGTTVAGGTTTPGGDTTTPSTGEVPGSDPPASTGAIPTVALPPPTAATTIPDYGGATVTIMGEESSDAAVAAINAALQPFGEAHGIDITYLSGANDWYRQATSAPGVGEMPDGAPNVAIVRWSFVVEQLAEAGWIHGLPDSVTSIADASWPAEYFAGTEIGGRRYGVPVRTDLKSLIWYQPARFAALGYEVPTTWEEFRDLVARTATDGGPKALCVGTATTPWVFTDWVEDVVLREYGTDVYDQWQDHEIPFTDERIVGAFTTVVQLWSDEYVFSREGGITATGFSDVQPLLDGQCLMNKQLSFFSAFFPADTVWDEADDQAVGAFPLPGDGTTRPMVTQTHYATAITDDPATQAVIAYLSTAEFAQARQVAEAQATGGAPTGYDSAAAGQDVSGYSPVERSITEALLGPGPARPDASNAMPTVVQEAYEAAATALIRGELTAQQAAEQIEAAWPT